MNTQQLLCLGLAFLAAYIAAALFVPTMAALVVASTITGAAFFAWRKLSPVPAPATSGQ